MNSHTPGCVLITGGAGFIGSHVVLRLAEAYPSYRLVVLDKLDYCSSLQHLEPLRARPNFRFIKARRCRLKALTTP